ncbi:hypothetical protein VP01_2183g3 [Puccinia sorghi]|uniref:No apical meristem-associated C-terminal domain-containing protein n=1 Tax=Puccinia sorghi TaxID=27349 RepID=A0A0L6V9Y2_9BASI|nr:hypothetical protein VP01_2183g3 [Puccinia sorghi]
MLNSLSTYHTYQYPKRQKAPMPPKQGANFPLQDDEQIAKTWAEELQRFNPINWEKTRKVLEKCSKRLERIRKKTKKDFYKQEGEKFIYEKSWSVVCNSPKWKVISQRHAEANHENQSVVPTPLPSNGVSQTETPIPAESHISGDFTEAIFKKTKQLGGVQLSASKILDATK